LRNYIRSRGRRQTDLEDKVKGDERNEDISNALDDFEESEDDPVCEPLLVVFLISALDGLITKVSDKLSQ
jgi:hypothetical protein